MTIRLCARALFWQAALVLLLVTGTTNAATRAWLDRTSISLGETVTLNVEAQNGGEPDFSVLEQDFNITNRSTSTQMQITNGAMTRSTLWAVALEPRHEGVIGIPALAVGQDHTEPLTLTVAPMARGSAAQGDAVFLELEVDDVHPYVQQQVIATVRLFYAVSLLDGQLDEPAGDGLQVRRIGDDVNYTRQLDGRRYNVVERRYAVSADRSGSLQLGPVGFRGRVAAPGRYGSFFNQGTPLSTGSQAIEIDVRPAPDGAPAPWIPAQALTLTDDAARLPAQAKVGDALTLTLQVEATGLSAEQIPPLQLPAIEGAEVYPDQETQETRVVDGRQVGVRSRKFAIVPQRAGALQLPERSLTWWNLADNRSQRSTLPARSIEIEAAAIGQTAPSSSPVPNTAVVEEEVVATTRTVVFWQVLAGLLALVWLATLVAWYWQSRPARAGKGAAATSPSAQASLWRVGLTRALADDDLSGVRRSLLRMRPDLKDLDALATQLQDPAQSEAVRLLDRALYRGDPAPGVREQIRKAFVQAPHFHDQADARQQDSAASLPPLYPPSS